MQSSKWKHKFELKYVILLLPVNRVYSIHSNARLNVVRSLCFMEGSLNPMLDSDIHLIHEIYTVLLEFKI